MLCDCFFFFKQKTAYEIGTGDWSSDVCSSDLDYPLQFCSFSVAPSTAVGHRNNLGFLSLSLLIYHPTYTV